MLMQNFRHSFGFLNLHATYLLEEGQKQQFGKTYNALIVFGLREKWNGEYIPSWVFEF